MIQPYEIRQRQIRRRCFKTQKLFKIEISDHFLKMVQFINDRFYKGLKGPIPYLKKL